MMQPVVFFWFSDKAFKDEEPFLDSVPSINLSSFPGAGLRVDCFLAYQSTLSYPTVKPPAGQTGWILNLAL